MNKDPDYKHIAWCDIETTGLDPHLDVPLEIALVLTDLDLTVLAERSWLVLPAGLDIINLDSVVRDMHNRNGLFRDILDAQDEHRETTKRHHFGGYDPYEPVPEFIGDAAAVDKRVDNWLRHQLRPKENVTGTIALGGSGVSHFESRWLPVWFPHFNRWLHRSTIDVGVMRRFVENVANRPRLVPAGARTLEHRAMDDVKMHLREGRKYRDVIATPKAKVK